MWRKTVVVLAIYALLQASVAMKISEASAAVAVWDPQQCIEEKCPTQWAACQADPKCVPALQECDKKCGGSTTCWSFCLSGKGSQAAINVAKCASANHCVGEVSTAVAVWDPQQCIEEKCPTQWAACQADPKCVPALQECDKKCGGSTTCWSFCLSGKGSQAAINVAKCAQANHCVSELPSTVTVTPYMECMAEFCENHIYTCHGDLICHGFLHECKIRCKKDQSCHFDCMLEKRVYSPILNDYFTCSGEKKCI